MSNIYWVITIGYKIVLIALHALFHLISQKHMKYVLLLSQFYK